MPSSSARPEGASPIDGARLLEVARASIRSGVERGRPIAPDVLAFPAPLREPRASFVTLERGGALRGCIGGLEPTRPLVADVAEHAFAAAFRDPRFPPVRADELPHLAVHLSVLSALEEVSFASEADLLARLRPGVDGLLLEAGACRGTFLPAVWEQLPEPRAFLRALERKAGLGEGCWSRGVRVHRYTVVSIAGAPEPEGATRGGISTESPS
jgi:hypothetical protein